MKRVANEFRRLARACATLSLKTTQNRRRDTLRAIAAHVLDLEFEQLSPFPSLDVAALSTRSSDFIALPPLALLEPGNQDHAGLARLVLIARALDARRIFEVGTYNGITAMTLARNLPNAVVETLDLPDGAIPLLRTFGSDRAHLVPHRSRHYAGSPVARRIVQHFGDSAEFDFEGLRGAFDVVYIDGAHSRQYVENDTRIAFEIVKPSGAIVWDDYQRGTPEVAEVLHAIRGHRLVRLEGTRMAIWLSPRAERLVTNPETLA